MKKIDPEAIIEERQVRSGAWVRHFPVPAWQRAYEAGQADGERENPQMGSANPWHTWRPALRAYWLGYYAARGGDPDVLPEDVRSLPALARHLHEQAAWITADAETGDDAVAAVAAFIRGEAYDLCAQMIDQLTHRRAYLDDGGWVEIEDDPRFGKDFSICFVAGSDSARVRACLPGGFNRERQIENWWEAHTTLGELLAFFAYGNYETPDEENGEAP
jgi:hypothetical protein